MLVVLVIEGETGSGFYGAVRHASGDAGRYTGEAVNPRNLSLVEKLLRVGRAHQPTERAGVQQGTELKAMPEQGAAAAGRPESA